MFRLFHMERKTMIIITTTCFGSWKRLGPGRPLLGGMSPSRCHRNWYKKFSGKIDKPALMN